MRLSIKQMPLLFLIIAVIACSRFGNSEPKSGLQYLVKVECKEADCNKIIEQTIGILETRARAIGVSAKGERGKVADEIIFRIGNIKDPERVKRVLFSYDRVELLAVVSPSSPSPVQTYNTPDEAKAAVKNEEEVLPYSERDVQTEKVSYVVVKAAPIIANEDIRDAQAISDEGMSDSYRVSFTLRPEGAKKFGSWTGANINQYLAVALNKKIKSIAYIKSRITENGEITGYFTKQQAEDLALVLSSGRFPAPIKLMEEKIFGKE